MSEYFKAGPRAYVPILEPLGLMKEGKQMHACLSCPTRTFGVELLPNSINDVKLFFGKETFIVSAFIISDMINEALGIQRKGNR